MFSKHDTSDKGRLTFDQIDETLHDLRIYPITSEGFEQLYAGKLEADNDHNGLIAYREFSVLIGRMQEVYHKYQAAEQVKIGEDLGIMDDQALFHQVRDDLESLKFQFETFDDDGNNYLDQEEVWAMLGALGLVPKTYGEKQWMASVMKEYSKNSNTFTFPRFVKMMTAIRSQQRMDMREYLKHVFRKYDRNGDGVLSVSEISKSLEDLGMCPRSSEEQKMIQEFLEIVGENTAKEGERPLISLTFEGFIEFMQHVRERMGSAEREAEMTLAADLNFSSLTVSNFRIAFSTLDVKGTGSIPFAGVRQVLAILKYRVPLEKLKQYFLSKVDGNEAGEINFMQLLQIMKQLERAGFSRMEDKGQK